MKKLLILASVAVFAVSCKKDDDSTTTNSVVGTWKITKVSVISGANNAVLFSQAPNACEGKSTLTFQSNNTVSSHSYALDTTTGNCTDGGTDTSTYSYNKNTKILTVDGEDMEVVSLNKTTMELHEPSYDQDYNSDGKTDRVVMTMNR